MWMWMDVDSNDLPQTLGLRGFIVIYGDLWLAYYGDLWWFIGIYRDYICWNVWFSMINPKIDQR
jgi:hypothetical protein